jgi:hypothetical protein
MDDRCPRGVLSEVLGLVSTQQSLGLDLWSWSAREFLVEADYTGHTCGILSCTKSLILVLAAALSFYLVVGNSGCVIGCLKTKLDVSRRREKTYGWRGDL